MSKKDIAVVEESTNALTVADETLGDWGASPLSAKDIIIPRMLVMQPMSDMVTAGEAAFGEFRDSLNKEKFGDFKTPLEFIPFHLEKLFVEQRVIQEGSKIKKEFLRVVPITPENEDLPYEDVEVGEDGKEFPISRDYTMNFYILLPSEIETGGIPYILSARRTSLKAGKKLATQMFMKNRAAGKSPAAVVCKAIITKQQNDEGTFAVLDIATGRPSTKAEVDKALEWYKMVRQGKAKAAAESLADETPVSARTVVTAEVMDAVETGPSNF